MLAPDGEALEQTLKDLSGFAGGDWPAVLSAAVVPVGDVCSGDGLVPVDRAAQRVIAGGALRDGFREQFGSRFAWLSDEWYLMAGYPLPDRAEYEDLPKRGTAWSIVLSRSHG